MKDAYYFSHDSNAKDDPKCMLLIDQLGLEGYGIFWVLVEILRDQPGYKYPIELIPIIARRYNTSKEKMLAIVNNYNLFQIDDQKNIFSLSLNTRMEHLEDIREKRRIAGIASGKVRRLKALNKCSTSVQDKLNKHEQSKVKERKGKESNINISHVFYKNELELSKSGEKYLQYEFFYKLICGKTKYHSSEMHTILNFEKQVSYLEFCKLFKKSRHNGQTDKKLSQILMSMANDNKYTKGKTSLYLTINGWLNRDFK